MAKILAHVRMFAEPIEVEEDELHNLRTQGLLIEDEPASAPSVAAPAASEPKATASKPAAKKE